MKPACLSHWSRWCLVVLYAIAMAWVESAVVYYLRTMIHRIEPYQPEPFPVLQQGFGWVELVREFATLVMLFAVGVLAGRTWRARWGYFVIGFGVWDIGYYAFLKVMCGWPHGLLDWDVLFLLPMPWWGPVLAPVMISLLMIFGGTLASQFEIRNAISDGRCRVNAPADSSFLLCWPWWLSIAGVCLALYTFMADTLAAVPRGLAAVCDVLPQRFNWPLFCLAWLLMAAPLIHTGWRRRTKSNLAETRPHLDATPT